VKHLKESLEALDGVTVLDVAVGNARIVRDDATCSVSQLEEATEEAGYPIVAIEPA
jgi:copper chaperone CopZ